MVKAKVRVNYKYRVLFMMISIVISSVLIPTVLMPKKESETPFYPTNRSQVAHSFTFVHRYFSFDIKGSFYEANWTLYSHNLVRNISKIIFTGNFSGVVRIELENGVYTLLVDIKTDHKVFLHTSEFGLSILHYEFGLLVISSYIIILAIKLGLNKIGKEKCS